MKYNVQVNFLDRNVFSDFKSEYCVMCCIGVTSIVFYNRKKITKNNDRMDRNITMPDSGSGS